MDFRDVRVEHLGFESPRQQCVVDAPQHVTFGIAGGESGLGDQLAGVAPESDFDLDTRLFGEEVEGIIGR